MDRAGTIEACYMIEDMIYGTDQTGFPDYQSGIQEVVDPKTITEWTGLYDHTSFDDLPKEEQNQWLILNSKSDWKGRRIFEGDILYVTDPVAQYVFIIRYGFCGRDNGYIGFHVTPATAHTKEMFHFGLRDDLMHYLNECHCIVIGNVFDNPEMCQG